MYLIRKSTDLSRVVARLRKYKVVSFDIFDTLISRSVPEPHDVFSVVEAEYNCRYSEESISDFRQARVDAEYRVRAAINFKEVSLETICEELSKVYGAEVARRLAEVELAVESQLSIRKPIGYDVYVAAISAGLRVVLTSDMYLSKEFIAGLLAKNGIDGYSELFVSSELDCMKSDGSLFDYIYEKLGIQANEMIHLGDHLKSDFLRPILKGGASYWLPKPRSASKLNDAACLKKFLQSKQCEQTIEEEIGYNKLGPLLFGFSHWIRQRVKKDKVDRLLFLARDGKIMQEAFQCVNVDEIKNDYLFVSRQVLIHPMLWLHPELEEIQNYASISEKSDIGSVLERLGLRDTISQEFLDTFSLTFDDKINGTKLTQSEAFVKLYEAIRPQVIKHSKQSFKALVDYLKGLNLSGKVGLVDIGWNGSMQRAFKAIIEATQIDVEITGYYFGVNPTSSYAAKHKGSYNGYLFDHNHNFDNFIKEECFRNIFETLFVAPHGSVRAIHEEGEIEMYDYEYDEIEGAIHDIQISGIQFVKDYGATMSPAFVDPDQECYYDAVFKMGLSPSRSEAKYFGEMKFFDVGLEYLAKVPKGDVIAGFRGSKWKIGYMVNLTGLSLPYHLLMQLKIKQRVKR
ncbi:MAG: HAD family hydrolase [Verrucomicrobiota bacterium]